MVGPFSLRFPDVDLAFIVEFAIVLDRAEHIKDTGCIPPADAGNANAQVHRNGGKTILQEKQSALQDLHVPVEGDLCIVVHADLTRPILGITIHRHQGTLAHMDLGASIHEHLRTCLRRGKPENEECEPNDMMKSETHYALD